MDKILKTFGLTPVSRKKLKGSSSTPTDEEDFLDEL
jgi:phage terminase small subunit